MMAEHIILNRTSETVLRFLPPYILERQHVQTAVAALDTILTNLTAQPEFAGHAQGKANE
jgi:acetylornithine aminotransferase/acetylornithine/N-succinyldiaminopimelate aminotransferase